MTNEKKQASDAAPVGHNEVIYPRELPVHSLGHIINHLRGVESLPLPELGQHGATIVGCSCEMMKTPMPIGATQEQPYGNPQSLSNSALADALEEGKRQLEAPQAGLAGFSVPAWLIPIFAEAAMRIFKELFKLQTV